MCVVTTALSFERRRKGSHAYIPLSIHSPRLSQLVADIQPDASLAASYMIRSPVEIACQETKEFSEHEVRAGGRISMLASEWCCDIASSRAFALLLPVSLCTQRVERTEIRHTATHSDGAVVCR